MLNPRRYLYRLTFPNGMVYIGSTHSVKQRWAGDGKHYRGMNVYAAITEYGWSNVKKEVLLELRTTNQWCDDKNIKKLEAEFIKAYGDRSYNRLSTPSYTEERCLKQKEQSHKNHWTIDGVTKPSIRWCEEYGKSYAGTLNRIEKHGLTPLQALTFPLVPKKSTRNAIEYWKSLGLLDETTA